MQLIKAKKFESISRSFLQHCHSLLAGCSLICLILFPVIDLGNPFTPVTTTLNSTQIIINKTAVAPAVLPSTTQIFLMEYSPLALSISWLFSFLTSIAMVNSIERTSRRTVGWFLQRNDYSHFKEELKTFRQRSRRSKLMIKIVSWSLIFGKLS